MSFDIVDQERGERERVKDRSFAEALGATLTPHGTRFALWSSRAQTAAVRLYATREAPIATIPLARIDGGGEADGRFEGLVAEAHEGTLYKLVLDGDEVPDPYARFLPFGVHGPARIERTPHVDRAPPFVAPPLAAWIIYEVHVGTFTPQGTYRAAAAKLSLLAARGINAIELMPLASFDGARGWGYDGVALFAPHAAYGTPDDLRAFIAEAHAHGIATLLDAVYNHFGPSGNYLARYSPEYFTARHRTAWGDAPDFSEPHLRRLVLDNVRHWLEGYGFDGLRLDATHGIFDPTDRHILSEIAVLAHGMSPPRVIIAEDERNDPSLLRDHGLDAVWADDFHHVLHVTLTDERDGYYAAYRGGAAELARVITRGWLYEGEHYGPTGAPRGKAAEGIAPTQLVYCIQNHDQVGNRAFGDRLHSTTSNEHSAAAAVVLLFLPSIPLLFMGQEWAASAPFAYFTDHEAELGAAITRGRREELKAFSQFADAAARANIPDPQAATTFEASRIDWSEATSAEHAPVLALYERLLRLRREDPVFLAHSDAFPHAEAIGDLLVVRRSAGDEERVLLFNAGTTALESPLDSSKYERVVASAPFDGSSLPPKSAAIFSRRPPRTPAPR